MSGPNYRIEVVPPRHAFEICAVCPKPIVGELEIEGPGRMVWTGAKLCAEHFREAAVEILASLIPG